MRLIIMTLSGCDRPADYEALKAYLLQHIPTKPSELVTVVPKGLPGGQFVARLGDEFGIPTTCVRGGVAALVGPADGHLSNATFISYGDAVTYAMDEPNPLAVVVGDQPTESALRFRQVCQQYDVPCHFVRVAPTGLHMSLPARDVTPVVTQVSPAPQVAAQEPYIFPQSHSSLSVFETCPRQYEAKYITREVKFVQGPEAKWGDDVHVQLENYLKSGGASTIPTNMAMYKPFADWVLNRAATGGGEVLAERMLAVTKDLQPCAYKDKSRWMGAKIDVTILYPATNLAEVFDWKTGKMKDDRTQLQQYAAQTLSNHPEIATVASGYIWLKDQVISPPVYYQRADLPSHWDTFQHKYALLRDAYVRGVFPPKPNGLCSRWCDVVSCEFHGQGRR